MPLEFQTKISEVIFISPNRLTCTTNPIPLKNITISILSAPSHTHHKSHSPKNPLQFPFFPHRLTRTTNPIPLKPITISILSTPSHTHHKSHSPKAHYNFLHPPVNFSISPPNISLNTTFLNSSLQLNTQLLIKTKPQNIPLNKYCCKIELSKLK
jgi:hypothetical protein